MKLVAFYSLCVHVVLKTKPLVMLQLAANVETTNFISILYPRVYLSRVGKRDVFVI